VRLENNELVDERARYAALNGAVDFQGLARSVFLREWQGSGTLQTQVSHQPWFKGQREDRKFVTTVSRLISGYCAAGSHLSRFRIVEKVMCVLEGL
jgi:hypothetical protein